MGRFLGPDSTLLTDSGFFGEAIAPPVVSTGWIARTIATSASNFLSNVTADGGTALLVDGNGELWRSTDGGMTWADTGNAFPVDLYVICASAGTFLLFSITGNTLFRSTNGGTTWSAPITTTVSSNVPGTANGLGHWIVGDVASGNISASLDDGLTWVTVVNPAGLDHWVISLIWDGAQYIASGLLPLTGQSAVTTSANGVLWMTTPVDPFPPEQINNTWGQIAGQYLAPIFSGAAGCPVRRDISPAAVATSTDILTNLPGNTIQCVLTGNGKAWAFDDQGNVAGSTDGLSWTQVPLNFLPGDAANSLFQAYDAVNHQFIAIGALNISISTHTDADIS